MMQTVRLEIGHLLITIEERTGRKKGELMIPIGPVREMEAIPVPNQTLTLTDIQAVDIGPVEAVDQRGNKTTPAGPIKFAVSSSDLLTLHDKGDGTATVTAAGPLGTGQITASDGQSTGIIDVTVVASAEAGLQIAVGTPHNTPAP